MTTLMLAGSRFIPDLPEAVKVRLLEWIEQEHWLLVGEAPGVDTAFQKFLASQKYGRVGVFTALPAPRLNLGLEKWEVRTVDSGLKSRGAAMHTVKDRKMVELADGGLMVWDEKSVGTLVNIIDFVERGRSCHLWTPKDYDLWEIDSPKNLEALLVLHPETTAEAKKRLATFHKREAKRDSLEVPPETSGEISLFDSE
jgi:hypothetical protein